MVSPNDTREPGGNFVNLGWWNRSGHSGQFSPRAARYLVLVRDTTAPLNTTHHHSPNEGGEKQFFRRRTENPCPHMCFTGSSTFAAPAQLLT